MIGATATATELQNNFGRYLKIVMSGQEVVVTKNGKEIGRFVPKDAAFSFLTDSLAGILTDDPEAENAREDALRRKYASLG